MGEEAFVVGNIRMRHEARFRACGAVTPALEGYHKGNANGNRKQGGLRGPWRVLYGVPVHHTKPGMALTLAEILDPDSGQTEWLVDAPRARELEQHLTIIGAARRDARRWQIKNVSLQWSAAPAASRVPLTLKVRREG
jgi:hypothetical protein